jgi:hypothetical protein
MTTRRWMIVVALVGLACATTLLILERRKRFARIAWEHFHALPVASYVDIVTGDERRLLWNKRVMAWHAELSKKYQYAARYPWLPVDPDLPEPVCGR